MEKPDSGDRAPKAITVVEPHGHARGTLLTPVGRNPFSALRASKRRLRSLGEAARSEATLFAFLPAQGRGFLRRRVNLPGLKAGVC